MYGRNASGINTELFLSDKKIKAKFKYADKLNMNLIKNYNPYCKNLFN